MSTSSKETTLILGMVFSRAKEPKRGQEYRDRVRCEALENIGHDVYTLDNKHADENLDKHCCASFTDVRRMRKAMDENWGENKQFDHVILDYFFSPVGWARERWSDGLFEDTLPKLAEDGVIPPGGKVWLPNLQCTKESIDDFCKKLSKYFIITMEKDPKLNPLYLATEDVEHELLLCPDALTNETQLKPLQNFSNEPFYVLEVRDSFLEACDTPNKRSSAKKRNAAAAAARTATALAVGTEAGGVQQAMSAEKMLQLSASPTKRQKAKPRTG